MKIISKNKDYYDFLQGIYGVDEKIILDRTIYPTIHQKDLNTYLTNYLYICLYIGEYKIQFAINKEGKIFATKQDFLNCKDFGESKLLYYHRNEIYEIINHNKNITRHIQFTEGLIFIGEESPCYKFNYPIVFLASPKYFLENEEYKFNLCLNDFNVAKIIPPHDVYLMIQDFLSKQITLKENQTTTLTNNEKIISHGFDLKESFRNTKEK